MRAMWILVAVSLAVGAMPALADETTPENVGPGPMNGPPPTPPPPPSPTEGEPGEVMPPDEPPVTPPPTTFIEVVPPPTPCPTVTYEDIPCYQRRDACGWPLDCSGCRYGRFEITLEGSYAALSDPDGLLGPLAIGAAAPQFDWEELEYCGSFGGRGALRYAVGPSEWLELRGTYYGLWEDDTSRVGTFGFRPGIGGAASPLTSNPVFGELEMEAQAFGGELNYQAELLCKRCLRADILLGARYFHFEEEASVEFANAPILAFSGPAYIKSDCTTQFVGLQAGGVFHWDVSPTFELVAIVKGFGGWVFREAAVSDRSIFAGGPHGSSVDEEALEWGAEVELGFRWRLTRWLSLNGGYNLFALDGVQRAHDAMSFTESTSGAVQAQLLEDEILIHSFFLGFTITF
jgi:hypothetical protein